MLLVPFALVLVQQFPCRLPLTVPDTKPPAATPVHAQSPVVNPLLTTFTLPTRWKEQIAIGFERMENLPGPWCLDSLLVH